MTLARLGALLLCALAPLGYGAAPGQAPAASFRYEGATNRLITPNGDGRNDSATFRFANPRAAAGSLRIYTLRGREVATVSIGATDSTATWAPPSSTPSGVYVFVIRLDDGAYSGAVAVVK